MFGWEESLAVSSASRKNRLEFAFVAFDIFKTYTT